MREARDVVSAAFYVNKPKNDIFFTEDRAARWTAANPPPGWPLPPAVINVGTRRAGFPARFTYLNFGKSTQKGLELGVDTPREPLRERCSRTTRYQAKPDPKDFDISAS